MRGGPAGVSIEALLEHRGWVRALARGLAADASAAEDLEQEVWLTALRRPPAQASGLRGWLARVLRSRAADTRRSEAARGAREERSARREAEPSTDRLAEVAELQARVARAVVALEEPYRSVVLLRYFEELPLADVAARTGAPLETVRTRLRRAHERLRERLDRDHRGDRRAWVALLAPLAREDGLPGPRGIPASPWAKAGLVAAAILVAAGIAAWRRAPAAAPPQAPPVEVAAIAPAAAPPPPPPAPAPQPGPLPEEAPAPTPPSEPPAAAPPAPAPAPAPEPPPPADDRIRYAGRVLDEARSPVPGATVSVRIEGAPVASATTDGSGRFEVAVPRPTRVPGATGPSNVLFLATAADGRVGTRAFMLRQASEEILGHLVILVSAARTLEVLAEDARGPVPGAEVLLADASTIYARAVTDPSGHATLGPLPSIPLSDPRSDGLAFLTAAAQDRGRGQATITWPPTADAPVVLRLSSRDLVVEVVDTVTGRGIPDALLRISERVPAPEGTDDPTLPYRPLPADLRTDRNGRLTVRGLGGDAKLVAGAVAEGYGGLDPIPYLSRFVGPEATFRIALAPSRRLSWPLSDAEGPAPPPGTVTRLRRGPTSTSSRERAWGWTPEVRPPTEARVEASPGGGLVLVADGAGGGDSMDGHTFPFSAVAVAPDGRLATLWWDGKAASGDATSFRTPRSATIEVRDGEDALREGVEVEVRGAGRAGLYTHGFALTDASGRAVVADLPGNAAQVFLRDPRSAAFERAPAGSIDLDRGDAFLAAVLPERCPLEILVRSRIDGQPRLPPLYALVVLQGQESAGVMEDGPDPGAADRAAGTLRATVWLLHPEERLHLSLGGPGFFQRGAVEIAAGRREGPVEVAIELGSAARPSAPPPSRPPPANPPRPGESREQRVLRILDTDRSTFEFEKMRLEFVLMYLGQRHGVPVILDNGLETEAGDLLVTVRVEDYTVRDAIREVLKARDDLTFVIRDGIVVVVRR